MVGLYCIGGVVLLLFCVEVLFGLILVIMLECRCMVMFFVCMVFWKCV